MLIRQAVTPAPPAAKADPAPVVQPIARKRTVPLGLLIALNVVLVLAIALVLYFVFRPAPPDVTPGDPLPAASNVTPTVPNAPKVTAPAAPSLPAVPAVKR